MEKSHLAKVRSRFPEASESKTLVVLHIPDEYDIMDPDLVSDLWSKVGEYYPLPDAPPERLSP